MIRYWSNFKLYFYLILIYGFLSIYLKTTFRADIIRLGFSILLLELNKINKNKFKNLWWIWSKCKILKIKQNYFSVTHQVFVSFPRLTFHISWPHFCCSTDQMNSLYCLMNQLNRHGLRFCRFVVAFRNSLCSI